MKNLVLIFCAFLLLQSCAPSLDKALSKVVSTTDFTPAQEALLATKCASEFPVRETTTEEKKTDSVKFKQALDAITRQYEDAAEDLQKAISVLREKDMQKENADSIIKALQIKQSARDSLAGARTAYKTIPCPETETLKTKVVQSQADLRNTQINLDGANKTIALQQQQKELEKIRTDKIESDLKAQLKSAEDKNKNRFWFGVLVGAGVIISLVALLKFGLKLKLPV